MRASFKAVKFIKPVDRVKAITLFIAKTAVLCIITLAGASCPLSCRMDDGAIKIVQNDYDSPKLESWEVTGARTARITFSKAVNPVSVYVADNDGMAKNATYGESGENIAIATTDDLEIGKQYTLGGQVRDGGGNTLHFAVPILGYNNNPAGVIISAVHPSYGSETNKSTGAKAYKTEFIQLYVTHGGNLSGFTIRTGKAGGIALYLPAVDVKAGEIITVHLQAAGNGCNDETGANLSLASSRYSSRVRDLWAQIIDTSGGVKNKAEDGEGDDDGASYGFVKNTVTNCLGESDDVILIMNGNGAENVLDAVMYATGETTEWQSGTSDELSEMAAEAGLWGSTAPDGGVILDKKMTTASILKRTGALSGGMQDGNDWVKTAFGKKIEQKVLTALGTNEEGSTGGNADKDGKDGEEEDAEDSGGSGSGGGTSGSGGGGTGRHPVLSLPPPACAGTPPRVIIVSVHPAYTSATDSVLGKVYKAEFIQLFVLSSGNLSHLTVSTGKLGADNFYPLPSSEVEAGDIVTVHLRRVAGTGCNDETGDELDIAKSWYSCGNLRDVWIDNTYDPSTKKSAAALDKEADAVAVFCGAGKTMMDAVFYSVAGTSSWSSAEAADIAKRAAMAGLWSGADPASGVVIDSHFTPASIMQRNGCSKLLKDARKGNLPSVITVQEWRKKPFSKKDEQDMLTFVD